MDTGETSKIGRLVDRMMSQVAEVADDEDWKESDGWVGKWTIHGENKVTRIYSIRNGKFYPIGE